MSLDTAIPPDLRREAIDRLVRELAATLGMARLPPRVAERAAADPGFLHALVGQRGDPARVMDLIAAAEGPAPKWAPPPNLVLLRRAGKALARWAAAGFGQLDAESIRRRQAACRACPHLADAGRHALLRRASGAAGEVCGLCSCAIERKTRLPTETCPAPDGTQPGMTRWGEPQTGD